jgi:hypothetical protein
MTELVAKREKLAATSADKPDAATFSPGSCPMGFFS